jgi:hypothetical protein
MGFVVDKVAPGAGFLRVLRSPLLILIPPTAPQSPSSVIRGWYNRSNSGRRTKWTHCQSHPTPRKKFHKDRFTNSKVEWGGGGRQTRTSLLLFFSPKTSRLKCGSDVIITRTTIINSFLLRLFRNDFKS